MTLFLIIFKQEQNAISCIPVSPRRVSFCRFVRVRFIEEENQVPNALCCIPVSPRRVSFLPFRESKVNRKEDVSGCKEEYNKLHLKGKSRKAQYVA